jgi:glycine/D-amino acid oxidase-like deaminating enzyme
MFSPRGVLMLAHTVHDVQVAKRHIHANRGNGVDNEWLSPEEAKAYCPPLKIERNIRYPVLGGALRGIFQQSIRLLCLIARRIDYFWIAWTMISASS